MRLFSLALIAALSSCKTRVVEKVVVADQPAAADAPPKDESNKQADPQASRPDITQETPEAPLGPNEWRDPINGSRWLLTGFTTVCQNYDRKCENRADPGQTKCGSDWRYPDRFEIVAAMNAGLTNALPASHPFYWTAEGLIAGRDNGTFQALDYFPGYEQPTLSPTGRPIPPPIVNTMIGLYCIYGPVSPAP